jgi:hypothetical protein
VIAERLNTHRAPNRHRTPSFIGFWNWLGIASHGGWFLLMPCIVQIPEHWRLIILSSLAVPLLLGHLMLLHARIVKRRRGLP